MSTDSVQLISCNQYWRAQLELADKMRAWLRTLNRDQLERVSICCGFKARRTQSTFDIVNQIIKVKYSIDGYSIPKTGLASFYREMPSDLLPELRESYEELSDNSGNLAWRINRR